MKVLVTGSTGRVGRAIHVRLSHDHDVVGFDRAPSSTARFVGELSDHALLRRALDGVDAVVHAAGLHAPQVGFVADEAFERVNVDATRRLAEIAVDSGAKQLVFTSTTALYGAASDRGDAAAWIDEATEPLPTTIYHRTKLAAETLLEDLSRTSGLAVTVLRMSRCFPEPAPAMAAYRLHRGVDARDVASAHGAALKEPSGFRRFVISGATPFAPDDAETLMRDAPLVLRRKAPLLVEAFVRRGWPLPPSIDRVYAPAAAIGALEWRPRFGFDAVLRMLDDESSEVLPPPREGRAADA